MADATPAPDPAPVPPIVNPTVATMLTSHGTLIRGAWRRFYGVGGSTDSVSEDLVLEAITAGTCYASQLDAHGKPYAVTATQPLRVVTPESAGTSAAATEEVDA